MKRRRKIIQHTYIKCINNELINVNIITRSLGIIRRHYMNILLYIGIR